MKKLTLSLLLMSLMVISAWGVVSAQSGDIEITIYMEGEIVSPEPGYVGGDVNITWVNVENASLKYQEDFCDGSLNGTVLKEIRSEINGSYEWNTTTVDDGPYCIKLTWEVNVLNNVSVIIDNTAPTVNLTDNHPDNIVRDADTILITANFTEALSGIDDTNVPKITISGLVTDADMTEVNNLIWTFLWDVPSGSDGLVNVIITATDNAGNSNEPATGKTSYTIDNIAPTLISTSITGTLGGMFSPANLDGLYDSIDINMDASELVDWGRTKIYDSTGSQVKYFNGPLGYVTSNIETWTGGYNTNSPPPYVSDGNYTIKTTLKDRAGNSNTIYVGSVIIDNTAPSISNLGNYTTDMEINNDNNVIINATIIDNLAGISEILLEGNWEGTWINYTLTQDGDSYYYNIDSTYLENQESVTWRYYAKDILGNSIVSGQQGFFVENRAPIFNGTIGNLSWVEDMGPEIINLADYFFDLDVDDLTYTSVVVSNPGPTSPSGPWDGIEVYIDNIAKIATILSTDNWNGDGTIDFTANDALGGIVSSNTVSVEIEADENDPPILGASITIPINFSEDESISFTLTCIDPDGQDCVNFTYDFEYVSYDDNLIVNVNSITGQVDMSATQDWNNVTYVKFLVDDDGTPQQTGSLIVKINVTPVNDNPILNIPDIEISEDGTFSPITLQVYTSDVDNLDSEMSYTLVSQSNDTLIYCWLTGNVIYCNNPLADAFGISELIIEVEDGSGGVGNQQFIINVTSVNDDPVILPGIATPFTTNEDTPFTIDLNDYEFDVDPYDGDTELTWSVSNVDTSIISITTEDDLLIITPLENKNGATNFNVILTDSFGAQDSQPVTVNIASVNDAPVLDVIGDQEAHINKSFNLLVNASDVDIGDILTFSSNLSLVTINPTTGVMNSNPLAGDLGIHAVNISVSDGEFVDYEVVLFNIIFENEVPIANNVNVATDEDINVLITLNCTDADVNDVLNYIIVTDPSNGVLSGSGDTITYYPDTNYNGTDFFKYKCSDGLNESNIATVDITVTSVNDALRIVSYSPTSNPIIRTGTQDFNVVVDDIDTPTPTYVWEVDGVPTGETTNSYTYVSSSDGEFIINVTASDGDNTVSREWILTVSSVPLTDTFTGASTTDFSTLDLSSANGVVLENDYGKIEFLDTLDLSDVFDLDSTVKIEEGVFAIDISIYPQLNKPARITLTGLSYNSVPEIFYSNQFTTNPSNMRNKCYFCEIISYTSFPTTDGIVVFETEHFSSFAVKESGIKYNLSEFEDLEMCVEGEQGDLIVEIEEPSNRDDFGPGDEIEIEVKVKNNADEDKKIIVEAYLYNVDEDDEVEDVDSGYEEIRDGRSETFDLIMIVPDDFEEDDDYILFVKAYEKGDEEIQCSYDAIEVQLEREKHKLIISEVAVDSSKGYSGGSLELSVKIENVGGEDEEDVYITIEQSDLGISEKSELFEIEKYGDDDRVTKRLKINIPKNALIKDYDFEIKVVYDDGDNTKLVTVSLIFQTVFEPVEKLDVIELTKPEKVISLDVKPVSKISVDKKAIFEPENILVTLFVVLIIGILIELIAIAIIRKLRKS